MKEKLEIVSSISEPNNKNCIWYNPSEKTTYRWDDTNGWKNFRSSSEQGGGSIEVLAKDVASSSSPIQVLSDNGSTKIVFNIWDSNEGRVIMDNSKSLVTEGMIMSILDTYTKYFEDKVNEVKDFSNQATEEIAKTYARYFMELTENVNTLVLECVPFLYPDDIDILNLRDTLITDSRDIDIFRIHPSLTINLVSKTGIRLNNIVFQERSREVSKDSALYYFVSSPFTVNDGTGKCTIEATVVDDTVNNELSFTFELIQ